VVTSSGSSSSRGSSSIQHSKYNLRLHMQSSGQASCQPWICSSILHEHVKLETCTQQRLSQNLYRRL
jgi:hypothetical protein